MMQLLTRHRIVELVMGDEEQIRVAGMSQGMIMALLPFLDQRP